MRMITTGSRPAAIALALTALIGCGGGGASDGVGETASAPAKSGTVWEIDQPNDRSAAGAAMLAYAHGLHVMVVDGDELFAGMTRLRGERNADGVPVFPLGDGLTATLATTGEALELQFSSGERVPMKKRAEP